MEIVFKISINSIAWSAQCYRESYGRADKNGASWYQSQKPRSPEEKEAFEAGLVLAKN